MEQPTVTKQAMDPTEIYRRNIQKMPNRVMKSHLRRKARSKSSMIDGAWATILSTVFESKAAPYIR